MHSDQTITAKYYWELLDELHAAVQANRRRILSDGCLYLQQNNVTPHTAREKLQQLHMNILPHPPHSPDLTLSDYYLFRPMKAALRGKTLDCEINSEVNSRMDGFETTISISRLNKLFKSFFCICMVFELSISYEVVKVFENMKSVGDRSEEYGGWGKTSIPKSFSFVSVTLDACFTDSLISSYLSNRK